LKNWSRGGRSVFSKICYWSVLSVNHDIAVCPASNGEQAIARVGRQSLGRREAQGRRERTWAAVDG